jgi:integrase
MNEPTFTQATLSKLLGTKCKRLVIHDPRTTGLRAELRAGGGISFYLFRRMPGGGRPMRFKLGRFPEITIEDARNHALELIGRMARGENPAELRRKRRSEATLSELHALWMIHAKAHKKTWANDQINFDRYLSKWKNRPLNSIVKADVRSLHLKLGEKHGHCTANRIVALLRSMFYRCAEDLGFEGKNPAARIQMFSEVERDRFIQPEEMPRFFAAVAQEPSETVRDFILLALFTGERRSQVGAMEWSHVSIERAEWRIPNPKQGKPHHVHLVAPALAILKRRLAAREEGETYVLPARHHGKPFQYPYKAWWEILKRAGLQDVRLHDLRRTLGSYMAIEGASLHIIGAALGHSRPETTRIYARLTSNAVAQKVDGAAKLIEASAKPKKAKRA